MHNSYISRVPGQGCCRARDVEGPPPLHHAEAPRLRGGRGLQGHGHGRAVHRQHEAAHRQRGGAGRGPSLIFYEQLDIYIINRIWWCSLPWLQDLRAVLNDDVL